MSVWENHGAMNQDKGPMRRNRMREKMGSKADGE